MIGQQADALLVGDGDAKQRSALRVPARHAEGSGLATGFDLIRVASAATRSELLRPDALWRAGIGQEVVDLRALCCGTGCACSFA